jgi:hypothetical protein
VKPKRPKLPAISEQVKAWTAALVAEVSGWPDVTVKSFFGFTALYRAGAMFAVLPRTRSLEVPESLAFKLDNLQARVQAKLKRDSRITAAEIEKARWFAFTLRCDADLHDALEWLGKAYEARRRKA